MKPTSNLCQCGCGGETNTDPKGEPRRFLHGHNRRGTSKGWLEQGRWYIQVDGKKKAFHRWLVEQREERTLKPNEIVHHLDYDQWNNDPDNLVVLTRAEHMRLHGKDKKTRWTREEKERAVTLRAFGMTIQEVAWALNRSYSGTQAQLARLGEEASGLGAQRRLTQGRSLVGLSLAAVGVSNCSSPVQTWQLASSRPAALGCR